MYPREDCGYQRQDIISLQNHVSEAHSSIFEAENSNNLEDLVVETPEKNIRKRKVTEALIPKKKSKKDIRQTKTKTAFVCDICQASLSRKDSLMRHIKKMHN